MLFESMSYEKVPNLESPVMEHTNMTQNKRPNDDVFFSVAQLQFLESLYPQIVLNSNCTEAAMRHYFGQQDVISSIRRRTRGLNAITPKRNPDDIPSPAG